MFIPLFRKLPFSRYLRASLFPFGHTTWSNRPSLTYLSADDGTKEITFRTILSIFTDSPRVQSGASPSLPEILNLFLLFGQYDNYPVILPTHFVFLRRLATVAVLWLIEKLARVYGLRPTYREYVPDHLVEVMKTSERGRFKSQ